MKTLNLNLSGNKLALRLTSAKLVEFAESAQTGGNTLFAVMDALDNAFQQFSLFEAALSWPGNSNAIQDGNEFLDLLIDEDYGPEDRKELILELAVVSGVISRDNAAKVRAAIHAGSNRVIDVAVGLLSGQQLDVAVSAEKSAPDEEGPANLENPT